MYAGHFAAALAIKARAPRVPTWSLLLGVGFLDVLFGLFVLAGWERVRMTPGQSPGFTLELIDWSHSAVMALIWALLFALPFARRRRAVAAWIGFAVFSHFLLDWLMHPGDLALWPHSAAHVGLGLWTRWPRGWWFFELGFIAIAAGYYVMRAHRERSFGGRPWLVCAVVLLLHIANSPWLAPAQ